MDRILNKIMNTKLARLLLGALALLALSVLNPQMSTLHAQGSLTPPGAPTATMKTLAQIEPRTPISSLPFTISLPGSYYVTTNLTGVANQTGITIAANNVTLDLGGFVLQGVANSVDGIDVQGSANIVVRNGTLSGWSYQGLNNSVNTPGLVVEQVLSSGNGISGFNFQTTSGFVVRDCICQNNNYDGIYANNNNISCGGTIAGCTLIANRNGGLQCFGCLVKNCQVISNGVTGIDATGSQLSGCLVDTCGTNSAGGGIFAGNCDIRDCVIQYGAGYGIYCRDVCQISECRVSMNAGIGIDTADGSTVRNCQVAGSGNYGIEAYGSTVSGCSIRYCYYSGIYVNSPGCLIIGNHCFEDNNSSSSSYNAGIFVDDDDNRVEDNQVYDSGYAGIVVNSSYYSGNVVVKNTVTGNGANNYVGTTNNDFGPIGTAATATSPWANISH